MMLKPILTGIDHLILAGDVWQECKVEPDRDEARQKYEELLEMISGMGIAVEILRGNHDPGEGAGVSWLAEKSILVTHGDAVYDDATPWSRGFPKRRKEVDEIIARYAPSAHLPEACCERAREIARALRVFPLPKLPPPLSYFATAFWPPSRTFEMVRVWREMGDEGHRFLRKTGSGARVLVCGHFHRAGIWEKEGSLVLNTGSFMKGSKAWTVDLNGDRLTARSLVVRDDQYHLGEVQGRWLLGN
jgi:predicted phosphodiesterase